MARNIINGISTSASLNESVFRWRHAGAVQVVWGIFENSFKFVQMLFMIILNLMFWFQSKLLFSIKSSRNLRTTPRKKRTTQEQTNVPKEGVDHVVTVHRVTLKLFPPPPSAGLLICMQICLLASVMTSPRGDGGVATLLPDDRLWQNWSLEGQKLVGMLKAL